jgi:hypothetical protein
MPAGQPTKYDPDYHPEHAYKFRLLGCTMERMAELFGVHKDTIYEWQKIHPEFSDSIKEGGEIADAKVSESLYHRALGYSCPEEKVFQFAGEIITHDTVKHYPPDATAIAYWLNNRQRASKNWAQRQELSGPGGGPIETKSAVVDAKALSDVADKL